MKKEGVMRKTVLLLLLALFLLAGIPTAFAQVKGAFAIVCNTTGARVYLSGELVGYTKPTFSMLLKPGQYTVKVTAKGYKDFTTTIQMTANPLNLEVNLESVNAVSKYPLSVSANVAGAMVFLNNSPLGNAPASVMAAPGSYTLKVTAPGYQEYASAIQMTPSPMTLMVNLQPIVVKSTLSVSANVPGARVFLNNSLVGNAPASISVTPGSYTVKVTAPGYQEYTTMVQVGAKPVNLAANLQPAKHILSVSANVAGAMVYVNNTAVGNVPASISVPPGNYTIKVTASGYQEYTTVVAVSGNTAHNAMLQQQILQLSVNANVTGAQLYINNALAGTIPFNGQLVPGSYTLRVTAPGYLEAGAVIALAKNEMVTFSLQPAMATVKINVNPMFLDPQNKNALSQVKIAVDRKNQNGFEFQLPAGKHNIRISSGGLSVAADYDIESGKTYTIEPVLLLNLQQ
jgi:hypothetical protein